MATCYIVGLRERCLELRNKLEMSQQALSSKLGIAHTTIVKWESKNKKFVRTYSAYLDLFRECYKKAFGKTPELEVRTSIKIGRKAMGKR